jgi:hypothetical protein
LFLPPSLSGGKGEMSAEGTENRVPLMPSLTHLAPGLRAYRSDRTSPSPGALRRIMHLGDTVNLIRKITNEVLPVELIEVLSRQRTPAVVVRWKSDRARYKLDLEKNAVLAIDATTSHRHHMKVWYTISEEHRIALTQLFWDQRKTGRK